jgi:hypothetical protein
MKIYSYRKKGKFADGTNKIIIEMRFKKGSITTINLPKPEILWDILKRLDISKGKEDAKIHSLREPKVHNNQMEEKNNLDGNE